MKHKRILAMILAVASCLSLAVSASAANTTARKATDFKDFDRSAWYADAVSAAVDNGLLYGKSSTIIDPNGDMTRAEMAAIINRSFGCYAKADISKYTPMRVCRIFGIPALFTPYRVSSATVHWGLYQYDLQALLNNPSEVFVLADHAEDFFYGTILTAQEIDLPRRSRIVPDGAFTMETRYCRPAEFEQEYGAA